MEFPSETELVLRVVLAAVLGGLIGIERELSDHPAGLRTHMALAMGASLFGVLSGYGFSGFDASRAVTNYQVDPTRVASTMVTGIGFLGGGAILKEGAKVRGLTTAASLWVTAAIGLACALGRFQLALATTAVVLFSLTVLRGPQRWLVRRMARISETVIVRVRKGGDPGQVMAAIHGIDGVQVHSLVVRDRHDEVVVQADVVAKSGADLEGLFAPLANRDDVISVEVS